MGNDYGHIYDGGRVQKCFRSIPLWVPSTDGVGPLVDGPECEQGLNQVDYPQHGLHRNMLVRSGRRR